MTFFVNKIYRVDVHPSNDMGNKWNYIISLGAIHPLYQNLAYPIFPDQDFDDIACLLVLFFL